MPQAEPENFRSLQDKAQQLRYNLKHAVEKSPANVLFLSGGLDSSILAALDPKTPGITVVLEGRGVDLRNAQQVAQYVGLSHWYPLEINLEQAMTDLPEIMRLNNTYDLGIKSDIPVYEGFKYAESLGFRTVRTGDASDELFGGYSYFFNMTYNDVRNWMQNAVPQIRLSSSSMAKAMNMHMSYPYLGQEMWRLALEFSPEDNIKEMDLDKPGDFSQQFDPVLRYSKKWGKILLRIAAKGLLPNDIIWRTKTPLEYGSGMCFLEEDLEKSLSQAEEQWLSGAGKHFWNKAHAKLYSMFVAAGLSPRLPIDGEYSCTWCGGGVIEGRHHCSACGAYPSDNQPKPGLYEKDYSEV